MIIYSLYVLFALIGIALIVAGALAKHRHNGGTVRIVVGIVVLLIPVGTIASSYLPRQSYVARSC